MCPEYANSFITFIVGLIAFVVYWLGKKSEKSNAATIVIMDIRHAEQVVQSILEKGVVDTYLKNILFDNNWEKYKHLFAGSFSQDDFLAFNRFFGACSEISEARRRMLTVFDAGLSAKAEIAQRLILEIESPNTPEWQAKRTDIINNINSETWNFDPDDPKLRIFKSLQLMGRLSNTIAFEKIKKISGIS
jgi:hypothetical protein